MTTSRRLAPLPLRLTALLALLLALLALGAVLLWSTPAAAQTARILVSNAGQGGDDAASTSGYDHAQLFHTAANTGATAGWVLTSVIVVSEDTAGGDFDVDICLADDTTGFPTETCFKLAPPDDFTAGNLEFTARSTGWLLNANDNYVVVFKGAVDLDSTTSAGQDSTGLAGWSIKDEFSWNNDGTWQDTSSNEAIRITVNGFETPANQDATGRPLIYPSAEGAGILFADPSRIADPNGVLVYSSQDSKDVPRYDWSYQWIRVDGMTETNVGDGTARYQPVDADIGKLIKVEVSFTDQHRYAETVTSLPWGPITQAPASSLPLSTLVGNTGQSPSATAMITQQYAMGFTLSDHGQGYEISSVSIDLAAAPTSLTVSLWIGVPPDNTWSGAAAYKLFDFENPGSFSVGLNQFTAPAGAFAYQNVEHFIVLSGFGASLSINETTSDAEDAGGETGAILFDDAQVRASTSTGYWREQTQPDDSTVVLVAAPTIRTTGVDPNTETPVLRLAVEGSRRVSGVLASNYAQPGGQQEIVSLADEGGLPITLGAADRYLIRGFSWISDDTTARKGGLHTPFDLRSGWTIGNLKKIDDAGTKWFGLAPTRYQTAGITVWTAPQGATVPGSESYIAYEEYDVRPVGIVLSRFHGTDSDDDDPPTAPGATLSDAIGDFAGRPLMAFLGEPLHAMVQNLGQTDNAYWTATTTLPVISQGFTTGPNAAGYELQGIGVNIEGSSRLSVAQVPDDAASVSVAVYSADADGKPDAKLFDLVSPTEYAPGHSFFEAPAGTTLVANTSYVVVWRHLGGAWHRLQITLGNSEDAGALAGFSIADAATWGSDVANQLVDANGNALEIAVYTDRDLSPPERVTAFDLHSNNSDPKGIWGNDETFWVANDGSGATDKLYAYHRSDGSRDSSSDFDNLNGAGNNDVRGICSDGTTMFVADSADNEIYAYKMSDTTADSSKDVSLDADNTNPQGLSCDGAHIWVANQTSSHTTSKIFVYETDGTHASSLDIPAGTLSPSNNDGSINNHDQRGMWSNGATLFVVDDNDVKIYAYTLSDRTRDDDKNIDLDAANADPEGLWFDGRVLWVVDDAGDKLYVYDLPGAQPENTPAGGDPTITGAPLLSATLTVKDLGSNFLGCDTAETNKRCVPGELLTDHDFSYDSMTYQIDVIDLIAGQLRLETDQSSISAAALADLTLHVGAVSLPFADATRTAGLLTWTSTGLSWSEDDMVELVISVPAPSQGQTLTADTSGISDAGDGLAYVYYHYQWIRDDGTDVTELAGETGPTYTATADDVGKNIRVRVVFDDHLQNREYPRYSPQVMVMAIPPPEVTGVALTSMPGADNTYAIDDDVEATVTFDKAVDISGAPQLELDFDGTAKAAGCATGTNTTTMVCSYTVLVNDSAPDGVAIAANKLSGGTITATSSTTAAVVTHSAVTIDADHKVDGIRPTLVTTSPDAPTTSADGTQVVLTFSEDIGAVSLSDIDLNVNSTSNYEQGATVSRSGRTVTLTLILTIEAGWPVTVTLSADAVDDAAGNGNLALAATTVTNNVGGSVLTLTGPTVSSVVLTSMPGSDNTYSIGNAVEATVTFSAGVDISGSPQLELNFAGAAKAAGCATGTNTTTMVCSYTVLVNDSAPNGVAIAANKLTGGTITATGSTTAAVVTHSAVAIDADHKVDGIRPTLVTTSPNAPKTSTDGTKVILRFSEDIRLVTWTLFTIKVDGVTVPANAATINSGRTVELTLTTPITAPTASLTVALAVGAVLDTASNGNLALAATAVTNAVSSPTPTARVLVSNVGQTADDVASTSGNEHGQLFHTAANTGTNTGGWTLTSVIVVTENTNEFDVEICAEAGTTNLPDTADCTALTAPSNFISGNNAFTHAGLSLSANANYLVVIDQRGAHVTNDNVAIDSTTSNGEDSGGVSGWSIKERFAWNNAGTWADKGGSAEALRITVNGYEGSPVVFTPAQLAPRSLTASLENGSVRLNWSAPEADAASVTGYTIFRANPQLTPAQPFAIYVSNTGNTDTAYLDEAPIVGTRNSYRVAAWRGSVASTNSNNAFVDVPVPSVSSVVLTSNPGLDNTYSIGNTVRATVTFSAAVDISGSPQLELNFDGTAKAAGCATGTNTTTMVCSYTVLVNDSAPDGIAIGANKLTGGTITATGATTAADLDHSAVVFQVAHKVDGIRPTLVTTGSDAPKTSADGTKIILTFSENVSSPLRARIIIKSGTTTLTNTAATATGTKVEVTLATALTAASASLTVELSAGAVEDTPGSNGNLALAATTVINAVASTPTVTGVALTSAPNSGSTYGIGQDIEATVTFSVAVDISGSPRLELDFDGAAKSANCATGTNTTTMKCTYTVLVNNSAPDGIAIGANKLTGGTIHFTGDATETADRDHSAVAIDANHKVDGIRPTLVRTGANAPTTSTTDGTQVILTFSEPIGAVDRTKITIGATTSGTTTSESPVGSLSTGTRLQLTLATALTSTSTNITVALGAGAVEDVAGNGNLARSATGVSNVVGVLNLDPSFPSTETGQREVAENNVVNANVGAPVAADDPESDALTYSLSGTDAVSFEIDSSNGQLRVATGVQLDYERKKTYRVTVQVSDGKDQDALDDMDAIDDTQRVTITVTNVNEPPVVTGPSTPSFKENSSSVLASYRATDPEGDKLTWSVSAPAKFWISDQGQLYFLSPPSFEDQETYPVAVFASDGTVSGSLDVTVTVENVEEPGVVTLTPPRGWEGTTFTADLDDDDGGVTGHSWEWERSSNRSSWTSLSTATGVSSTYTATTADIGHYLRATVTYTDAGGSNKMASATLTQKIEGLSDRPVSNSAPEFTEDDDDTDTVRTTTRTVSAGTTAGRSVGARVTATDADEGDVLTYSLSGADADDFDIDPATGQIRTRAVLVYNPDPDMADENEYTVTVSVHDGFGAGYSPSTASDATIEVTIAVTAAPVVVRRPPTRGGGGGGGGGGGRSRATPTPTPAPSATPTPTPTPTPVPTPTGPQYSGVIAAEPSVTATVVPEGTTLGLNGGGDQPGGVYVNFPPTAVALPVPVSVSVSNAAPDDVEAPSGTTLLPLTIDITPETPLTLGTPLTIEINPTPEQLEAAGGDLNNLSVGVVTPHGVVVLPAQVLHGRLVVTTDRIAPFVLVAITDPGPVLTHPPPGDASSMGPLLQWMQPPGTTWFQVQVIPFNEDGPGINLVIGDGALVQAAQYQVMAPNFGSADPNYVLLPDMTYLWRVRTSTVLTNPTEDDWSAWAASSFKTPPASSSTITRVAPPLYGEVRTLTPTLTWANSDPAVFYYEVQLSKDFEFGPNAFLYSEYVHGGASTPLNSYVVPAAFPLEAGAFYYWRVRPRIQGDGDPLPWSRTNVFQAPG